MIRLFRANASDIVAIRRNTELEEDLGADYPFDHPESQSSKN